MRGVRKTIWWRRLRRQQWRKRRGVVIATKHRGRTVKHGVSGSYRAPQGVVRWWR